MHLCYEWSYQQSHQCIISSTSLNHGFCLRKTICARSSFVCKCVCEEKKKNVPEKLHPRKHTHTHTYTHTSLYLSQLCMTYFGNLSSWTINIFWSFFLYGILSMEELTRQTLGLNISTLAWTFGQTLIKHEW